MSRGFRGPLAAERFAGGQSNPTYKLTAGSGHYVLRRKPPGPLLPSAHAVDREFRVMRALADTRCRCRASSRCARRRGDRQRLLCDGTSRRGGSSGPAAAEIASPAERTAMFDSMNRSLPAAELASRPRRNRAVADRR